MLEIGDDIINVFGTDGDADQVFCDTAADPLFLAELLVGCGPWVDSKGL